MTAFLQAKNFHFYRMSNNRAIKIFKKLHRWPAIIIAFFAIVFAFSGIVMNHRGLFSSIDVSRKLMPDNYEYNNWNLAAVRGAIATDSITNLMYGNIGIWKTSDDFLHFEDFNQGELFYAIRGRDVVKGQLLAVHIRVHIIVGQEAGWCVRYITLGFKCGEQHPQKGDEEEQAHGD